jgi:DNA-binding transcriptional LysR family regulator
MRGTEFAELKAFATIIEHGSFARAAGALGMSASTLSQIIRNLETRLGARLINRTTRSLSPTAAGQTLYARCEPAMREIEAAVTDVVINRASPAGPIKLLMPSVAASTYLEPVLGEFLANYPDVVLDVTIDGGVTDIIGAGYDIGARLGEFVTEDMVGVPLGGEQRQLAVASPAYLERYGRPETPAALLEHKCINWRQPGGAGLYRWEFVENGRWFSIAVKGPLIVSDRRLAVAAAVQGAGIAFWAEDLVRPLIAAGKLVPLLEPWCGSFPGWYLYYPKQRQTPPAVRAFVTFLRKTATGDPHVNRDLSRAGGGQEL